MGKLVSATDQRQRTRQLSGSDPGLQNILPGRNAPYRHRSLPAVSRGSPIDWGEAAAIARRPDNPFLADFPPGRQGAAFSATGWIFRASGRALFNDGRHLRLPLRHDKITLPQSRRQRLFIYQRLTELLARTSAAGSSSTCRRRPTCCGGGWERHKANPDPAETMTTRS
jgi:hypothetical protein